MQSVTLQSGSQTRDLCCNLSPRVVHRLLKSESDRDDKTLFNYQRFHAKRTQNKLSQFNNGKTVKVPEELDIFGDPKYPRPISSPNSQRNALIRQALAPLAVPSIRFETSCGSTVSCSPSDVSDSELSIDTSDDTAFFPSSPTPQLSADKTQQEETVVLPCRYRILAFDEDNPDISSSGDTNDIESREKDLSMALKWIRQEIVEMKAQDKSLLKQFIELRASILQLRCVYDIHGSCSDVSSLDGSTFSLNEQAKSPGMRRLAVDSDAIKPCLSLPNSPRVARFKWRSDEFI